ncbi:hypothetical protein GCM10009678_84560 [Actinomadura kijaniata]
MTASECGTVRVLDLATGRAIGAPIADGGGSGAVAVAVVDRRPVAVSGSGRQIGEPLVDGGWAPVLTATAGGRPVVLARGTGRDRAVWPLDVHGPGPALTDADPRSPFPPRPWAVGRRP